MQEFAEGKKLSAEEKARLEKELEGLRAGQLESERAVDAAKNELSIEAQPPARPRRAASPPRGRRRRRPRHPRQGRRARAWAWSPIGSKRRRSSRSAVAGLLGRTLQTVVVSDTAAGLELLAELQKSERGRAT